MFLLFLILDFIKKFLFICLDSKNYLTTVEAHKIKTDFFTLPVLSEICQQLLSRYFLLSENDLEIWENNPEEFGKKIYLSHSTFYVFLFHNA